MEFRKLVKGIVCGCMVAAATLVFTGCTDKSEIEDVAKDITTKLEQDYGGTRTCTKVKLCDEIGKNKWNAEATMSDGNIVNVIVEKDGDMVYVTAPIAE